MDRALGVALAAVVNQLEEEACQMAAASPRAAPPTAVAGSWAEEPCLVGRETAAAQAAEVGPLAAVASTVVRARAAAALAERQVAVVPRPVFRSSLQGAAAASQASLEVVACREAAAGSAS